MPGTSLAWQYLPSRSLSGDLFAVAPWDSETLGCYILDASGHGVDAAARAAFLAGLLSLDDVPGQVPDLDPGQILTVLNQRCPLTVDGQSFTVWLGIVSLATGELRFSSAGHTGALLLRREGAAIRVSRPSFPLGFMADVRYMTMTAMIHRGDRLLMFSDGLYDAVAPDGERWGLARVEHALAQHACRALPMHLEAVIADARAWQRRTRFEDDAALIGLEIS